MIWKAESDEQHTFFCQIRMIWKAEWDEQQLIFCQIRMIWKPESDKQYFLDRNLLSGKNKRIQICDLHQLRETKYIFVIILVLIGR